MVTVMFRVVRVCMWLQCSEYGGEGVRVIRVCSDGGIKGETTKSGLISTNFSNFLRVQRENR